MSGLEPVGLPKSRHEGRLQGYGTIGHKRIVVDRKIKDNAHLFVLQHISKVHPYLDEHMAFLRTNNPSKGERWLAEQHNRSFISWFKDRVMFELTETPSTVCDIIK